MSDLNDLSSSQPVKIAGASNTGVETTFAKVSPNQDLGVGDIINSSAVYGAITVSSSSAIELKVGANKLSNRKLVSIQPMGSNIYMGYDSNVNETNGTRLTANDIIIMPIGPNVEVWFRTIDSDKNIRIAELS